jgi:hypothetical protein
MAVWIVMMIPVAPLALAGLWTEELALLAASGLKAAYNVATWQLSRWLGRRTTLA